MPSKYIIEHWLLQHAPLSDSSLTDSQIGQAYARMGFASAGLLYLMLHAADFSMYKTVFLSVTSLYLLFNLISIPMIRRSPLSAFRSLFFPFLDVGVVSFSMLIDGGQSSGIFFLYLVIILGNGFRFGNTFLLYTQVLSLIGISSMLVYSDIYLQYGIDQSLLFWQFGTLLVIPLYVFLIGQRVEDAVKGRMEAEESAYSLLNKGPLPVFTFELGREEMPHILYANSAVYETFQRDGLDLVGARTDILVLPEDRSEMISFCREIFRSKQDNQDNTAKHMYIRSSDQSGNMLKLQCTAICMRWHKRWIGVCFMLDISARETMQEELESVHRQGYMNTLVAGIIHDFRNVLTNMMGYAEMLQMGIGDESAHKQLDAIIAAGDRGSELVTHLLKLSKNGETDSLPYYSEGCRIMQPLENIMGLARLQMPPHIKLVCQIDEPLHDVAISIVEIEQILMNLINNSMQAIDKKGHIHVRISNVSEHRLSKPEHPCMRLRVTDNGIGIKPDDLDKIFKAFWTSRVDKGGTGLGLTMVQRIIKRHHGSIEVESVANKETHFTIHLRPYISGTEKSGHTSHKPALKTMRKKPKSTATTSAWHVLLVDDMPDILNIHQAMLARFNHTSDVAENGKQALAMFLNKKHHFDLIITDFHMPVMNGLELVERIRKLDSSIPILMITAFREDSQLQRVADYHVTLLQKPVSMEKFQCAIAETMSHEG